MIGLTDVLLGLAVTAIALPGVIAILGQQTREAQDQVAAQQLKAVGEATRAYVRDHFADLYAGLFAGTAGADSLALASLRDGGYLSAGFAAQNPFRQVPVILLRIVADASPSCPTPTLAARPDGLHCKALMEAVVVTIGGTVLDPARASHVAVSAGADAGVIADGATVRGAFGGWCEDLSLFGGTQRSTTCPRDGRDSRGAPLAGQAAVVPARGGLALEMFFNGSEMMSEYLNRFRTGNPEDNTMHADLSLGGNRVTEVKTVQIAGVEQGFDADRMTMINDLFTGSYTANTAAPGTLSVANLLAQGAAPDKGNVTADGAVTAKQVYSTVYYHSSDAALKTNIRPIEDPLLLVDRLQGHRFQWRADGSPDVGFVAQEVRTVLPEAVGRAPDGGLTVKYDIMAAPLVEAVKALSKKIDQLEGVGLRSPAATMNNQ
jgi:type II secretory pathway pseudopilin PulG